MQNDLITVTLSGTPALSFITLRNIANFIGVLSTKDTIEFLEECGMPTKEIDQKESSQEMIYGVLKNLALSQKDEDREVLEKIIKDSINPTLYKNISITLKEILTKYNEWLKTDDFEIVFFKEKFHLFSHSDLQLWLSGKESLEKQFVSNIKEDVLERITEIKYAYTLLIKIISISSQHIMPQGTDINNFYIELFKIVEGDVKYAHSHIENIFGEDDTARSIEFEYSFYKNSLMSGNYIQPYIYQDEHGKDILYKPFLNLYSAQSEIDKTGEDWDYITKRMNACYGILEDRFHRFGADTITNYPHKNYIDQVGSVLDIEKVKKDEVNDKGSLTLYLKSGRIAFTAPSGNAYQGQLRRGSNGYQLLKYLMTQPIGIAAPYMELAKHLNKQRENINSDEERRVRDAIQSVRNSLKLKTNDTLFITDYGFGLSCNSIIESTE